MAEKMQNMENDPGANEGKMPITYGQLRRDLQESGRPYDFDMIDRAYALAGGVPFVYVACCGAAVARGEIGRLPHISGALPGQGL